MIHPYIHTHTYVSMYFIISIFLCLCFAFLLLARYSAALFLCVISFSSFSFAFLYVNVDGYCGCRSVAAASTQLFTVLTTLKYCHWFHTLLHECMHYYLLHKLTIYKLQLDLCTLFNYCYCWLPDCHFLWHTHAHTHARSMMICCVGKFLIACFQLCFDVHNIFELFSI